MLFDGYTLDDFFDEMFEREGSPRTHYAALRRRLGAMAPGDLQHRRRAVDLYLRDQGVTFTVYADDAGIEKIFPFDPVPRIVPAEEWGRIERGLVQRIEALNLFLDDVYHRQHILRDGVVDPLLVHTGANFRRRMIGLDPPKGIYIHVMGTDLVRGSDGVYRVLEDNARTPSGVSYLLQSREVLRRAFPDLFADYAVRPVADYADNLRDTLANIAPAGVADPTIVLLTPGVHNSAYFEHSFLARQMGIPLVEGRDLIVRGNAVFMRSTRGLERVHVIYRRIDDDFLDPVAFRPDSMLGCAGVFNAYRAGHVGIANAIGTGIADDKAIYPFVPAMVRYYLQADPILDNVPTLQASRPAEREHILAHLDELVVKETNNSGGYGMLIGPYATAEERERFRARVRENPRTYIAQPVVALSRHPTWVEGRLEGRCVDLRPYILYGNKIRVTTGGLTRVALRKGSLVVNSSQGGGYKDTWVLAPGAAGGPPC